MFLTILKLKTESDSKHWTMTKTTTRIRTITNDHDLVPSYSKCSKFKIIMSEQFQTLAMSPHNRSVIMWSNRWSRARGKQWICVLLHQSRRLSRLNTCVLILPFKSIMIFVTFHDHKHPPDIRFRRLLGFFHHNRVEHWAGHKSQSPVFGFFTLEFATRAWQDISPVPCVVVSGTQERR